MKVYNASLLLFFSFFVFFLNTRSHLRPKNNSQPQLIAKWENNDSEEYHITDSHIEEYPLFVVYNKEHFLKNLLPSDPITYRYEPKKSISGTILSTCITQLIQEIRSGNNNYTDFTLIQDKDFSYKKAAGLIVLRFKQYPFILKLFIETPESFVNPWCKGSQPVWFFYMGGGVNRHITGLTRIKNKELLQTKIARNPEWSSYLDTPRKWFWQPKNQQWISLTGKNINGKKELTTLIPSTYAIIADEIVATTHPTISEEELHNQSLELCNQLDMFIDPHIDNFLIEEGTNKLVIIDTEHFPTLVGFKEKQIFTSYIHWLLSLAKKATHDIFFRLKSERIEAQYKKSSLHLFSC